MIFEDSFKLTLPAIAAIAGCRASIGADSHKTLVSVLSRSRQPFRRTPHPIKGFKRLGYR
jgi:hypothetical protein